MRVTGSRFRGEIKITHACLGNALGSQTLNVSNGY